MYQDNEFTTYGLVSSKAEPGRQANALGHLAMGLHALVAESALALETYCDSNGRHVATISRFPFVVLSAKNANQIRAIREKLEKLKVPHNAFASQMLASSSAEQHEHTANTTTEDLDCVALVAFGPKAQLEPLFRKFSIYRGQHEGAAANQL